MEFGRKRSDLLRDCATMSPTFYRRCLDLLLKHIAEDFSGVFFSFVSLLATSSDSVVKVPRDARERHSCISDHWLIAIPHPQVREMHRTGRRDATGRLYTTK